MNNFEYRKVSTLEDACMLLDQYGERAKILAGGTDLLIKMRNRALQPGILDRPQGGSRGLDEIRYEPAIGLRIGALTSIHRLETSRLFKRSSGESPRLPPLWGLTRSDAGPPWGKHLQCFSRGRHGSEVDRAGSEGEDRR